jgi:hypothetical protein
MISKISSRALMLGAVLLSLSLSPAYAEPEASNGAAGDPINSEENSSATTSPGGAGSEGNYYSDEGTHPQGYDGGNGGAIDITINGGGSGSSSPPSGVTYSSTGGDGGTGAAFDEECEGSCPAADGGNGGNGGSVDVTLDGGTVYGNLTATSQGGAAGAGGEGGITSDGGDGDAGNGGDVTITVEANSEVIGAVIAKSLGGEGDPEGHGGKIEVTISGDVAGDGETGVWAKSDGGEIHVLIDGAKVTGTISADSSNGTKELSFQFKVSDRDEFNAAKAVLLDENAAHGTVTINGHPYEWFGFSTLANLLTYVGPEDEVKVVVESPADASVNETPAAADEPPAPQQPTQVVMVFGNIPLVVGQPERARCTGSSEVRTVRQDDGSIVVIYHRRGEDTLIGQLKDGTFNRSQEGQDWDVKVGSEGKSVDVTNGGNSVSSCSFS